MDHKKNNIKWGDINTLLGYSLRKAHLSYFNKFIDTFSEHSLSHGLFTVMAIVHHNPGLNQTAVSQAMGNDRSAMVSAVNKLEQQGLIERRPSKTDLRSYMLYLTDSGEERFQRLHNEIKEYERQIFEQLDPGEKEQLLNLLRKLSEITS
jgi:DNA-binding MarR family transcriptional regulator